MANSLVKTTFEAGPADKMIAVDVYGEVGAPGASNHIQAFSLEVSTLLSGGFGSALEGLAKKAIADAKSMSAGLLGGLQNAFGQAAKDITNLASQATSLISGTVDQINVNKAELTNRLLNASSDISTAMRGIPDSLSDSMVNSIPLNSDLMCSVGDITTKISSTELNSVQAVGGLINEISQSDIYKVQDTGAISGIMGSIVGTAAELGVPNAFGAVTSAITDTKLLNAVVRVAVPKVLSSGNMETLSSMGKSSVGKIIEALVPGTAAKISKIFKAPTSKPRTARADYSANNVIDTISNIKPNWNVYKRNKTDISVNLTDIMGGSADFKKLIKDGVTELSANKKIYQFAALFKPISVGESLTKDFPKITISSLSKTRKAVNKISSPNLGK